MEPPQQDGRRRLTRAEKLLIVLAVLFLVLTVLIHLPDAQAFDERVSRWLQGWHGPIFDRAMLAATFLGDAGSLLAMTVLGAIGLWAAGDRKAALLCLLTPSSILINLLLKEIVGRPRPPDEVVVVVIPAVGLSYPSGHAMAGAVFFGFWALLAWSAMRASVVRSVVVGLLWMVGMVVGISRIYLGVHWLSDVLAGWTAALFLLVLFAEGLKRRQGSAGFSRLSERRI